MNAMMDRRSFMSALGVAALSGLFSPAEAAAQGGFVMWHSPGCGCCLEWAKRMEASFGRKLPVIEVDDIARVKRAQGVPGDLGSCHTALVHGYVVEGHVPPADIKRLVKSGSKAINGLAVPGMPAGSPGMDVGHDQKQPYKVIAFAANGKRGIFARHG
jgi:hypothetical protein